MIPTTAGGDRITQPTTVARSVVRGEVNAAPLNVEPLRKGPAPSWIYGREPERRYFLRKQFQGGSRSAILQATCDNEMTVSLNGRVVATSTTWEDPVLVDVQDAIKPGTNEIVAEVNNEGATGGFVFKLALTSERGETRYVVSDGTWKATAGRESTRAEPVRTVGTMGDGPWGDVFGQSLALPTSKTPRDVFQVPAGFRVEHLVTVPRDTMGSWVSITFDDKGRLIASDEGDKGICRITPSPIGSNSPTVVEHLDLKLSGAQGLLHAFGSLYLAVNSSDSALYRVRDTDGDEQYDKVEKLAPYHGAGEHGPHALKLAPDGRSIYVLAGNHTLPPDRIDTSLVPRNWGEDHLLPRQWDANGHARGILAPGGWVARTDPEGKTWEMVSIGYRNSYDMAFNPDGEMIVYDADMEWDYGMPWYRPTRVTHSPSGSEFGWRSGTGKWPASYVDSLPPLLDIGPGSPVGVTFGTNAKFPARYQKALFICDWTFGTMYALHLEPSGATYRATKEEFLSRTPLPLTDTAVGPDGALYFTIGGRGTQSELYRVTYVGDEATTRVDGRDARFAEARATRHRLEKYHRRVGDPTAAVAAVYPSLGDGDRFIRYAARVALEHQDPKAWQDRVLAERDPETLITGAVALARQGDHSLQPRLIAALDRLDLATLPDGPRLELLRAWQLAFIRMGEPDPATARRLAGKFDAIFPSASDAANRELAALLVYLKSPTIAAKLLSLMEQGEKSTSADLGDLLARNKGYGQAIFQMTANRPEAQNIHYAFVLRNLRDGWTPAQRMTYFRWLEKARGWSGGASYQGFINNIDKEAFENTSEADRLSVEAAGARRPYRAPELPRPRGPGHAWTMPEIQALATTKTTGRNFAEGQRAFNAARCVLCHRFGGEGGATGPDLTQAAGRFAFKDLGEAIIEPSKVVSDQYRASTLATTSGKVYSGRIVGESATKLTVLLDPEDSSKVADIARADIEDLQPSKVSIMPEKLLDPLNRDEILDLFAYLLSRGDPNDPMFAPSR